MCFLTSTNSQSWFNNLTGYDGSVTIESGSCIEPASCEDLGRTGGPGKLTRLVFYLTLSTTWLIITFISFILVMYILQLLLASNLVL